MHMLAQGGAELIISLLVFGVLIINAIAQAIKYVKRQQGGESEGPEEGASETSSDAAAAPKSDLQRFLEELSRQAQGTTAQRATPTPPSAVKQSVKPIQPAQPIQSVQPRHVPVARPAAAPPPAAPVHRHRKVVRKGPVPVAKGGTHTKGVVVHKHEARKEMLAVAPPTPDVTSGKASAHTAAERLDEALPTEPLKRAVALRELLGPCRAQSRYLPGRR